MRNLFVVLLVLGSTACSSWRTAPPATPVVAPAGAIASDVARICVVRTSHLAQAVAFPTWDNGTLVGATKGPTHFCWLAAPGKHELTMEADHVATASVTAEPGRDYVLEQDLSYVFGVVDVKPAWVSAERAQKLFADSDYEVLSSVPSDQKLPDPLRVVPAR
jgi:hypothetical protein